MVDGTDKRKLEPTRRAVLARLGLAAGVTYAAPVLLRLNGAGASSLSPGSSVASAPRRRPPPPPEIVVAAPLASHIDLIAQSGFVLRSRDRLELVDSEIARFSLPGGYDLAQARQRIAELVPQAIVDIDHVYRTNELTCGDDTCRAFDMIGWTSAGHACRIETVVGMIDTSINRNHEALAGIDIEVISVVDEGRRPASPQHGTAIAVLLAGRSDSRTPGLLEGASVIAAEAFHRSSNGLEVADAFDIARALDRLVSRRATVINLSFAGPANTVLERVVTAAIEREVILVAAAGNAGPHSEPLYPAAYRGVVAVTAIDRMSRIYRQANRGEHIDFAAPGVRLWTAASIRGARFRSGTSYAAPFVSAVLAAARASQPFASAAEIIDQAAAGAVDLGPPGRDATYGWGLIQHGGCVGSDAAVPASGKGTGPME